MSLDLFQQEANDRLTALPPVQNVDPGMWDGFIRGTGMATMKGFAKAARAVDLLGAVVPIAQDTFTGGTEAQDKYFAGHDAIFGRAVDYWTPKPQEVGMAGEVMGSLLSVLPQVIVSPSMAVATTQLGTAEDLANVGVTTGKAQAVGAVQALTLGTGIWMPILGKNLWQRAVIGGAGFNLVQGTGARAVSGAILEDTPAKDMFKAFDSEAMTLDVLMGLAFGGLVHLSPTQRAQGAAAWDKIESWAKNLNPSDKAAIATLREAQHLNVDSTPGKPVGTPDIEAHVERMRAAIDQLATDQPVNVEDITIPRRTADIAEAPPQVRELLEQEQQLRQDWNDAETSRGDAMERGDQEAIALWDKEMQRIAGDLEDVITRRADLWQPEEVDTQPRFEPDPERTAQAEATVRDLQAAAETVRAEEGIPPPPQEPPRVVQSVRRTIEEELARAGRPAEEAAAGAAIWDAFYTTMAKRIGTTVDQLWAQFPLARITNEIPGGEVLKQVSEVRTELESLVQYWRNRTWKNEAEARENIRQRIVEDNERYPMFTKTDPAIVDQMRFTRAKGGKVKLVAKRDPRMQVSWSEERPTDGNTPDVDWFGHDNQDKGTPESIKQEFGRGKGSLYQAWIPTDELPIARGEDIHKGVLDTNSGVRSELEQRGEPPPIKIRINPGGKPVIMDGNHRLAYWRERGMDAVPAWVIDERPQAKQPDNTLYQDKRNTWYKSALGEAITNLNMKQGDAKAWLQALKGLGNKGVKAEEVKWSGIEEWLQLQEGKITKEQVQEFLANNGVKVEEVMLGNKSPEAIQLEAELARTYADKNQAFRDFLDTSEGANLSQVQRANLGWWAKEAANGDQESAAKMQAILTPDQYAAAIKWGEAENAHNAASAAAADILQIGAPKYGNPDLVLPGGENYRELLLTLPSKRDRLPYSVDNVAMVRETETNWIVKSADGKHTMAVPKTAAQTENIAREIASGLFNQTEAETINRTSTNPDFQSSHFDQPNILAHVRFNERTDAEGKRVLFIEEFQSDWAQKGKKEGFNEPFSKPKPVVTAETTTIADYAAKAEIDPADWLAGKNAIRADLNEPALTLESPIVVVYLDGNPLKAVDRPTTPEAQIEQVQRAVDRDWEVQRSSHNMHNAGKPPAAPFVGKTDAWVALALKRMIAYAAENGFDRVAWTRGEQQVERYTGALRKAVDVIEWTKTDKGVQLVGYKGTADNRQMAEMRTAVRQIDDEINTLLGNRSVAELTQAEQQHLDNMQARRDDLVDRLKPRNKVVDTTEKEDALSDAIGKAMAEKIISDPNQSGTIEGENIRIDSTGMAGFYDRIVPKVANEVLKKLGGGKVGETKISNDPRYVLKFEDGPYRGETYLSESTGDSLFFNRPEHAEEFARLNNMPPMAIVKEGREVPQQSFDITPKMKEAVAGGLPLFQKTKGTERGYMSIGDEGRVIGLLEGADASTFVHESGHFFLDTMAEIGKLPDVPAAVRADLDTALTWMGLKDPAKWVDMTLDEKRPYHEKFARGFEQYLREGKAPSEELKGVFQRFRDWLVELYKSAKSLNVKLNDDIRGVMNRMLADQTRNPSTEAPPAPSVRPGSPPPPGVDGEAQAGAEAQMRAMLQDMALNETGWAQEGGKLLDRGELGTGKPSFTTWIPKAEWWPGRPDKKLNAAKVQEAVRKYLAGEKLKPGEQRTVDYMIDIANARNKGIDTVGGMEEYKALAEDAWDEGLDVTTENVVDLDLVARAAAIDEAYVERAALKYENDDAAFRGELEMLIYETERTQAAEAAGRSKAGEQKTKPGEPGEAQKPTDIVRAEADLIVEKNPDMPITVGVNPDGTPMTMTAREFLDQARAEADLNRADIPLLEVAAQCLLGVS